jgi:hypothetical protein
MSILAVNRLHDLRRFFTGRHADTAPESRKSQ